MAVAVELTTKLLRPNKRKSRSFLRLLFLAPVQNPYSLASRGIRDLARSSRFDGGSTDDSIRVFFFIPALAQ